MHWFPKRLSVEDLLPRRLSVEDLQRKMERELGRIRQRLVVLECPHKHVKECVTSMPQHIAGPVPPGHVRAILTGPGTLTTRTCLDCGKELSREWVEDRPKKRGKR